MPKLNSWNSCI